MTIKTSITKSVKGAIGTFELFPVVILNAALFTLITYIRIQLDWSDQEPYNFLFNCLHLAFASGAALGLVGIAFERGRFNEKKSFFMVNGAVFIVTLFIVFILYNFGASNPDLLGYSNDNVSSLSAARISVLIAISLLGFIYFLSFPRDKSSVSESLFMFQKAFVIAFIYGIAIMMGTSGIAGAIQALLYNDMSEKVYMYLAATTGFVAFTLFVGYFPSLRKGNDDQHRIVAQKQPRFFEVLLSYILVPIISGLTVVLLLWIGKTVLTGEFPEFNELAGIVISYSLSGIWLYLMLSKVKNGLVDNFKRVYPIVALVILSFGLYSFVRHVSLEGFRTQEYFYILIWLFAVVSIVMMLIKKAKEQSMILLALIVIIAISTLPIIGYQILPVSLEINRLEQLLTENNMLVEGDLIATTVELDDDLKIQITTSVNFIAYAETRLPDWFDRDLRESNEFSKRLGFEKTWREYEYNNRSTYLSTSLTLSNEAIEISDYDWAVYFPSRPSGGVVSSVIEGKHKYRVLLSSEDYDSLPKLRVQVDEEVVIDNDLKDYIDELLLKYPLGERRELTETFDDLSYLIETDTIKVLVVFRNINIQLDPQSDEIDYYYDIQGIYISE